MLRRINGFCVFSGTLLRTLYSLNFSSTFLINTVLVYFTFYCHVFSSSFFFCASQSKRIRTTHLAFAVCLLVVVVFYIIVIIIYMCYWVVLTNSSFAGSESQSTKDMIARKFRKSERSYPWYFWSPRRNKLEKV